MRVIKRFIIVFLLFPIWVPINIYADSLQDDFNEFYLKYISIINDRRKPKLELLKSLERFLKDDNIELRIFAKYIKSLCLASPKDNFNKSIEILKEINKKIRDLSTETKQEIIKKYFRKEPMIDIQALTKLNEVFIQNLKNQKNIKLAVGISNYFFQLEKLFYLLSSPPENCGKALCLNDLFYEVSINNAVLTRYFYNEIPIIRQNTDQIKLWYIDIFKHVPDK